jgi:hypothetical protein
VTAITDLLFGYASFFGRHVIGCSIAKSSVVQKIAYAQWLTLGSGQYDAGQGPHLQSLLTGLRNRGVEANWHLKQAGRENSSSRSGATNKTMAAMNQYLALINKI